jgi:hypothetical protein
VTPHLPAVLEPGADYAGSLPDPGHDRGPGAAPAPGHALFRSRRRGRPAAPGPGHVAGRPHHPEPALIPPAAGPGKVPETASLPVAIYIRDACWIFEIDLDARNAAAGAAAALPGQIVIGDAGDGLGAAAATIASALRAAGNSASAVRFVGVVDDFIALSASGAYAGGALPRHARQPTPAAGRHRAPA